MTNISEEVARNLKERSYWYVVCSSLEIYTDVSESLSSHGILAGKTMDDHMRNEAFQYKYLITELPSVAEIPLGNYCIISDNPYLEFDLILFLGYARKVEI